MSKAYVYLPISRVTYGNEAIYGLPQAIEEAGASRVAIITTTSLQGSTGLEQIQTLVGEKHAGTFSGSIQHTPTASVIALAEQARAAEADAVISFGGGSAIDSAKALVLALAENVSSEQDFHEYAVRFTPPDHVDIPGIGNPTLPHIAIPTTLSAAEFSNIAGVTNRSEHVKQLYMDPGLTPKEVFLDPSLTLDTPMWLWLSSGIRAVDHAVETLYSKNRQPITSALAERALSMLRENLSKSKENPQDLSARTNCQLASWMSFFGVSNVMLGLCHGIGHQIGAHCDVPHGHTSCTMLPHVMRYSLPATLEQQKVIAESLGAEIGGLSDYEAASRASEEIETFIRELELPQRLRDVGVSKEDFDPIAKDAMEDLVVASSPQPVENKETIIELLEKAW